MTWGFLDLFGIRNRGESFLPMAIVWRSLSPTNPALPLAQQSCCYSHCLHSSSLSARLKHDCVTVNQSPSMDLASDLDSNTLGSLFAMKSLIAR
jgi:hypothetical protein